MSDLLRDAPIGQLVRFMSKKKYLKYPEEKEDFQCPSCYGHEGKILDKDCSPLSAQSSDGATAEPTSIEKAVTHEREVEESPTRPQLARLRTARTVGSGRMPGENVLDENLERVSTRLALHKSITRQDLSLIHI